ncbi:MAG: hypothetical protein QXV17_09165 [Candidatus Micrarchaeaceae archaeon]
MRKVILMQLEDYLNDLKILYNDIKSTFIFLYYPIGIDHIKTEEEMRP